MYEARCLQDDEKLIVGIDVGASTTKGVIVKDSKIMYQHSVETLDPESSAVKVLRQLISKIEDKKNIGLIAASGGGSRKIGDDLLGIPVKKVNEIQAIGLGGLVLARKNKGLIVSAGTGTAMVAAYDSGKRIKHVGGTGVGGGTVLGLAKGLLGVHDFAVLEAMALEGNTNHVDLTVADIVGGPVGIVPGKATASNFGRIDGESSREDVAAGIFNLVSQVIGVVSAMAAKDYSLEENVVLVGRLVKSSLVSENIRGTTELFGVNSCVPRNCEYCVAVGAAAHLFALKQ